MNGRVIGIRTHGGADVGLGHVRRCLTLGRGLGKLGARIAFAVNDGPGLLRLIRDEGFDAVVVKEPEDVEETAKWLKSWGARAVIADSYSFSVHYLRMLRERVGFLAVIDDLADRSLPADAIVNGTVNVTASCYRALPHTLFLLGPRHMLLREEFAQHPCRSTRREVERVLITVGGSNPRGLTEQLIRWTWTALGPVILDIVIGPFFEDVRAIEAAAMIRPGWAVLHVEPAEIRALMLRADIAVTGGGQTTYELAAAGTPALGIRIAENQTMNLSGLAAAGSLDYVGNVTDGDLDLKILKALRSLADDEERRAGMSAQGRALVDGRGAERVASAMHQAIEATAKTPKVTLCPE